MSNQRLTQTQRLEIKLSPQQIQLMKLLQLPTIELEQRIKEEIEANPALEDASENEEFEDKYMDEKGKFDLRLADPLAYSHGEYYTLGEKLGKFGYSVRK